MKLGKLSPGYDPRDLLYRSVMLDGRVPEAYDVDDALGGPGLVPTPMFANEAYACCVISGRGHQTLRFEWIEQSRPILIADREVLDEYFYESGGIDSGLVVRESLKAWRKRGWRLGGDDYCIRAFAQVAATKAALGHAIYANDGAGLGLLLPASAQRQFDSGVPWSVVLGDVGRAGSWGGHYVYALGYDPDGVICATWGRRQHMSWAFIQTYCDEAWAIVDARNSDPKLVALDTVHNYLNALRCMA